MIAASLAVVLCERMSALPLKEADSALVVLARLFRVAIAGRKVSNEGEGKACRRSIS
jgi:uncharacterized membrane protein